MNLPATSSPDPAIDKAAPAHAAGGRKERAGRRSGRFPGKRALLVGLVAASLLFMAPFMLLPYAGAAQSNGWQPAGLRGEAILALHVTSSDGERLIYVETLTGLWRSSQVAGWQRIDEPLPRTTLGGPALAAWRVVPGRARQLYALTGSGTARQLFRSDNAGLTWQNIGPAPGQISRPPMLVLAGANGMADTIALPAESRVQRSTDSGATWGPGGLWPTTEPGADADAGRKAAGVRSLLGDGSTPERLYALTEGGVLWLSESGGRAWHASQLNASENAAPLRVDAITIAPYFGIRIWAATPDTLLFSGDSGATWTAHPLPAAAAGSTLSRQRSRVTAMVNDPRAPDTIYVALSGGAVYRSDDTGATWTSLAAPRAARISALALDPDTRAGLWAATEDGLWYRNIVPPQPQPMQEPTVGDIPSEAIPGSEAASGPAIEATRTSAPTATPSPTASASPQPTATDSPSPAPTVTPSRTPLPTRATATPEATEVGPTPLPPTPAPIVPTSPPAERATSTPQPPTAQPTAAPTEPRPTQPPIPTPKPR